MARVIRIGRMRIVKRAIIDWAIYNGNTFVWVNEGQTLPRTCRAYLFRPYKIPGDHGPALRAARVKTMQYTQRLATLKRLEDEQDERDQQAQNERLQPGDPDFC